MGTPHPEPRIWACCISDREFNAEGNSMLNTMVVDLELFRINYSLSSINRLIHISAWGKVASKNISAGALKRDSTVAKYLTALYERE